MKSRFAVALAAIVGVVVALLVASPSQSAVPYYAFVSTKYVSISSSGTGVISMSCHSSQTCRGSVYFGGSVDRKRSFSVPARGSRTVTVSISPGDRADPHHGVNANGYWANRNQDLYVNEDSPKNITHVYPVTTETSIGSRRIQGEVHGQGAVTDMKVELIRRLRGGNIQVMGSRPVTNGGSYSFTSRLGTNNAPGSPYVLRISGRDQAGTLRSWFWRGVDGNGDGGGRYLRDASSVRATKAGDFVADFTYSSITGTAPSGATVRVAATPTSFPSDSAYRRELDIPSCANYYGRTTSNGSYRVDFLPVDDSAADKRYLVSVADDGRTVWAGENGTQLFGSCHDVLNHRLDDDNLIPLGTAVYARQPITFPEGNDFTVTARFSGFSPQSSDRWITVREMVPGLKILDAPIVAQGGGVLSSSGKSATKTFRDVPPGQYWVEVGRRTGCSTWYPSVYPNNKAYFNGADRGAEAWKAFTKLSSLPGSAHQGLERVAIAHGATYARQGSVPRGYQGWMYRSHCKALGQGTVNSESSLRGWGASVKKTTSINTKGAIVKGRVTRSGGRTNKEMMVRLSSIDGKRVIRTDLTDSKGYFYVAGLPSGNWSISVNPDSWRGIGRSFSGKHTIRVTAGHVYNAGTLKFSG